MENNQLKIYNVYMEDGENVFKVVVPAANEKEALDYVQGNGDVIAFKENLELSINIENLTSDLKATGWRQDALDLITRTIVREKLDKNYRAWYFAGKAVD